GMIDHLNAATNDLRVIIEYYCVKARLSKRLNRKFNNDRLLSLIDSLFRKLDSGSFSTIEKVLLLFPRVYQLPVRQYYTLKYPNAVTNAAILPNPQRNRLVLKDIVLLCLRRFAEHDVFTTGSQFRENYTGLQAIINDKVEL